MNNIKGKECLENETIKFDTEQKQVNHIQENCILDHPQLKEQVDKLSEYKKNNTIFNIQNLDIVQHPNHYGAGENGLQCIEAMLQTFGKDATMAFCKLNSFKYLWRSDHKNKETQDIEKSKRYLEYWLVLNKLQGDLDDGTFHEYLNKN